MRERTLYRSAPCSNHVCCCYDEWSDDELYDLTDDDFDDEPCMVCGGRVVRVPPPVWAVEEEDDC
jgi:hypothetical protein